MYIFTVETRDINMSIKNNPEKFPHGYVFEITDEEKNEVVKNVDHLEKLKFSPYLPKDFTEKGLYMLATILKKQTDNQSQHRHHRTPRPAPVGREPAFILLCRNGKLQ